MSRRLFAWLADRADQARNDDRGSVVETVIIAAGLATLAIGVVAAISLLVNNKVAGISL
jgi:hypothetical protein